MAGVIRLLVSDIDGTLVTKDKRLTPAAADAARRLGEAGIALALTSSRPPHGIALFADPLKLTAPRGAFNGGMLVEANGTIVQQLLLAEDVVADVIERLSARKLAVWLFTADRWVIQDPDAHYVALEHRTVQLPPTVVDDFRPYYGQVGKIMASSEDVDGLAAAEAELQAAFPGRVSAHLSQPYYLDVTHPDANKGHAVRAIADHLGVDLAEVGVIGDMANDVPMFDVAPYSIAMGNAPAAVKARARDVTRSNEEDGFAYAVEHLVLPLAPKS